MRTNNLLLPRVVYQVLELELCVKTTGECPVGRFTSLSMHIYYWYQVRYSYFSIGTRLGTAISLGLRTIIVVSQCRVSLRFASLVLHCLVILCNSIHSSSYQPQHRLINCLLYHWHIWIISNYYSLVCPTLGSTPTPFFLSW